VLRPVHSVLKQARFATVATVVLDSDQWISGPTAAPRRA
jgi:hypothetical protein